MNYTDEQIKKALEKILNYLEKEKALKAELEDFNRREIEKIGKL